MPINCDDITFRPHRLGFFVTLAVLLGAGLACLIFGIQRHPGWYTGVALIVYRTVALVSRYTAGSLALRGYDLVLYLGTFGTHEIIVPLWETRIEIHQTLIGRLLDVGMIVVWAEEQCYQLRVAQLRALRHLVAERRVQLLVLTDRHTFIVPHPRAQVAAGELEEWG